MNSTTSSEEKAYRLLSYYSGCIFSTMKHQKIIRDLISVNDKMKYVYYGENDCSTLWAYCTIDEKVIIHFRRLSGLNDFHITSEHPVEQWKGSKVLLVCCIVPSTYSVPVILSMPRWNFRHILLSVLWGYKPAILRHERQMTETY